MISPSKASEVRIEFPLPCKERDGVERSANRNKKKIVSLPQLLNVNDPLREDEEISKSVFSNLSRIYQTKVLSHVS